MKSYTPDKLQCTQGEHIRQTRGGDRTMQNKAKQKEPCKRTTVLFDRNEGNERQKNNVEQEKIEQGKMCNGTDAQLGKTGKCIYRSVSVSSDKSERGKAD